MSWCLSSWTPSGPGEVAIVVAFWVAVIATGARVWTWGRAAHARTLTAAMGGDRQHAGTTNHEAPGAGARSGSTR